MRNREWKLSGAVTLFLLLFFPGAAQGGHETQDVATISADRVRLLLDAGEKLFIVDLRPAKEFQQKHIPGARSIPMTELQKRLNEIPRAGRVILYAATPQNETLDELSQFLQDQGYRNVAMIVEGFQGWVKRKFPVETGARR